MTIKIIENLVKHQIDFSYESDLVGRQIVETIDCDLYDFKLKITDKALCIDVYGEGNWERPKTVAGLMNLINDIDQIIN